MKKTVIININGIVFNIDEDAYNLLQSYINDLKRYFGAKPEANEIIDDIEARISELFQTKISEGKQSINIQDVEEIIKILGNPEIIAGAEEENMEDKQEYKSSGRTNRRLYRDRDNAVLGGVCSGLGSYFSVDPVVFRLLFIIFSFIGGVTIIIYIILWAAVPAAVTSTQKLEMRGENVTIGNIERSIREEYEHVRKHPFWHKFLNFLDEVFHLFGKLFSAFWNIFRVVFGIALILFSLGVIISMLGGFYLDNFIVSEASGDRFASFKEFFTCIIDPVNIDTLITLSLIVIAIPFAALIYAGLKLIIRFKANDRWIILGLFVCWFIAVITLSFYVFDEVRNFRQDNSTEERVELKIPKNNTLYVTSPGLTDDDSDYLRHSQLFGINYKGVTRELYGLTGLEIEKSSSDKPELEIIREARGKTHSEALDAAKQTIFKYQQTDSALNISPLFYLKQDQRWKFQTVKVILYLPNGMRVHLDKNTAYILNGVSNIEGMWDYDMAGRTWLMTSDGLSRIRK
jgi:phage shock protein PspC (stress-responsive transcriptional regulator)